jgi:3'-phosphoadenosine 5'-phosphosulfate sulfotransferase (PAPS reductase)/FAD synthetase
VGEIEVAIGGVQFYTIYKLRRMDISTVRLYLLCFAFHRFRHINDNLIEAFIHVVGQFDKHAKLAAKTAMQQACEEANSNLKAAGEVLGLFIDKNLSVNYVDTQWHLTERDDGRSEVVERKETALKLLVAHEQFAETLNQLWHTSTIQRLAFFSGLRRLMSASVRRLTT